MKRYIYACIVFLITLSVVTSCKDENNPDPQAVSTFTSSSAKVKAGEEIQFTNTSLNATAFRWSFGDGTTSKEISPKKIYQSSGVFTVSLVSSGAGGSIISSQQVTIIPDALFSVANIDDLTSLTPIQFTSQSLGATSFLWSFGNAAQSTSTEENPKFTYLTGGTYTVTLKAIASTGETTITKEITVTPAPPELYFIDSKAELIEKIKLAGAELTDFLDVSGKAGAGLAYDEVHGKIYFSDFDTDGEGNIWQVGLDGSDLKAVVTGLYSPYGIALDVSGGKIYWADDVNDDGDGHIGRANLDGSGQENIVTLADGGFRTVALDLKHGKIYYYEVNNEDLYQANLDGSEAAPILSGVYGYAIFVDTVHDKIYFDEQESATFSYADLDGTNIQTIDDNGTSIYGIAIDQETGTLYWSGRDSGEIYKSKLDGSDKVAIKSDLTSPRGIFLRK